MRCRCESCCEPPIDISLRANISAKIGQPWRPSITRELAWTRIRRADVPYTDPLPGRDSTVPLLDVTYEQVRHSFLVRLRSEEARLKTLSAALGSPGSDTESAFVDLGMFAHRLRGAAAVFGLPEIRDAAKALELAAAEAAINGAPKGGSEIEEAIKLLAGRLACLNGYTRRSGAPAMPIPAN